jgi:hypothetical protein
LRRGDDTGPAAGGGLVAIQHAIEHARVVDGRVASTAKNASQTSSGRASFKIGWHSHRQHLTIRVRAGLEIPTTTQAQRRKACWTPLSSILAMFSGLQFSSFTSGMGAVAGLLSQPGTKAATRAAEAKDRALIAFMNPPYQVRAGLAR